jgi:hypothetical protein
LLHQVGGLLTLSRPAVEQHHKSTALSNKQSNIKKSGWLMSLSTQKKGNSQNKHPDIVQNFRNHDAIVMANLGVKQLPTST